MCASILLVDDEVGITNSLKRVLRKDGYSLIAVDNGQAALELMERQPFDLVISDQRMPTMTGATLLSEVNRLYPATSRILFSGYCDFSALSEAVNDASIQRFLLKPWIDSEVRQEVRHVLEQSKVERCVRENVLQNLKMKDELNAAIKNAQLFNYFQPIFDTQSNQLYAAELFNRWHHPEKGLLATTEFFPLTQYDQAIRDFGVQQLDFLFNYLERVITQFKVCMNVSPLQLDSAIYSKKLESFCKQAGEHAGNLILEITETELAGSVIDVSSQLRKFKQYGVKIALDDFCTGYSSMEYLRSFPVDIVKIDRTFIQNIDTDCRNQFIVSSIIELADKFNVEVIAEGVEKPEQVTKLKQLGCFLHQGYLYGKAEQNVESEEISINAL